MEIRAYLCYNVTKRTQRDTILRKPGRAVLARMSKAGMNEKTGATIRTNERTIHEKKAEND